MPQKKKFELPKPDPHRIKKVEELIDIERMRKKRSPSYQHYPGDWLASFDVREEMNHTERDAYRLLIDYAWESPLQCFIKYDLTQLKKRCQVSADKFIRMWIKILNEKFQFAKYDNITYIYNERSVLELNRQHYNSDKNRKNALEGAKKRGKKTNKKSVKRYIDIPFSQSPFYDIEKFTKQLTADKYYENVDVKHYYEKLKAWSEKGKMTSDWIVMAKTFVLNDAKQQKLYLKNTVKPTQKSKIEKNFSDLAERREQLNKEYAE